VKPNVLFIVGPTASGKSKIAILLARRLNGEIISADSMLVYKGMDIGTAKPTRAERKKVKHHLIDLFVPNRNFSAFEYRNRALAKLREISRRRKLPIVVGGTGLYVRTLLNGMILHPEADPKFRSALTARAKKEGLDVLYAELKKKDSKRAESIKPTDERRIVRALEILAAANSRPEKKQESLKELGFYPMVIGITKDRSLLYNEIEKRVEQMFRKGLVKEVKKLVKQKLSKSALQAVGYKEVIASLKGEQTLQEAKALIKLRSRHLAKRQWTWFKREEGIIWVEWASNSPSQMVDKVLAQTGLNSI
jgi:tRNA dimethylallyltransferase